MDEVFEVDQPAPVRRWTPGRWAVAATASALVVAGAAVGVHLVTPTSGALSGGSLASSQTAQAALNGQLNGQSGQPGGLDDGGWVPPTGNGTTTGGTGTGTTTTTTASAKQQVGVVDIDTVLGYQNAKAAGTGLVVSSTGEILTNNHVIAGATQISVTVVTTGRTYTARVVGYDVTADLAVLQLSGASHLSTAAVGTGSTLSVGDAVVGVGNAGGVGGAPSGAAGTLLATDAQITATNEDGAAAEQLTGLIETDAPIAAGDSGGPLYDAADTVVGIDTAASTGSSVRGYAISIDRALAVVAQIEAGRSSTTVHLGTTAMLGVEIGGAIGGTIGGAGGASEAGVVGVVDGSPAASAGLQDGDVITAIAGHVVTTPKSLSSLIATLHAGQRVSLHWTDFAGTSHHTTVTLAAGPAL